MNTQTYQINAADTYAPNIYQQRIDAILARMPTKCASEEPFVESHATYDLDAAKDGAILPNDPLMFRIYRPFERTRVHGELMEQIIKDFRTMRDAIVRAVAATIHMLAVWSSERASRFAHAPALSVLDTEVVSTPDANTVRSSGAAQIYHVPIIAYAATVSRIPISIQATTRSQSRGIVRSHERRTGDTVNASFLTVLIDAIGIALRWIADGTNGSQENERVSNSAKEPRYGVSATQWLTV